MEDITPKVTTKRFQDIFFSRAYDYSLTPHDTVRELYYTILAYTISTHESRQLPEEPAIGLCSKILAKDPTVAFLSSNCIIPPASALRHVNFLLPANDLISLNIHPWVKVPLLFTAVLSSQPPEIILLLLHAQFHCYSAFMAPSSSYKRLQATFAASTHHAIQALIPLLVTYYPHNPHSTTISGIWSTIFALHHTALAAWRPSLAATDPMFIDDLCIVDFISSIPFPSVEEIDSLIYSILGGQYSRNSQHLDSANIDYLLNKIHDQDDKPLTIFRHLYQADCIFDYRKSLFLDEMMFSPSPSSSTGITLDDDRPVRFCVGGRIPGGPNPNPYSRLTSCNNHIKKNASPAVVHNLKNYTTLPIVNDHVPMWNTAGAVGVNTIATNFWLVGNGRISQLQMMLKYSQIAPFIPIYMHYLPPNSQLLKPLKLRRSKHENSLAEALDCITQAQFRSAFDTFLYNIIHIIVNNYSTHEIPINPELFLSSNLFIESMTAQETEFSSFFKDRFVHEVLVLDYDVSIYGTTRFKATIHQLIAFIITLREQMKIPSITVMSGHMYALFDIYMIYMILLQLPIHDPFIVPHFYDILPQMRYDTHDTEITHHITNEEDQESLAYTLDEIAKMHQFHVAKNTIIINTEGIAEAFSVPPVSSHHPISLSSIAKALLFFFSATFSKYPRQHFSREAYEDYHGNCTEQVNQAQETPIMPAAPLDIATTDPHTLLTTVNQFENRNFYEEHQNPRTLLVSYLQHSDIHNLDVFTLFVDPEVNIDIVYELTSLHEFKSSMVPINFRKQPEKSPKKKKDGKKTEDKLFLQSSKNDKAKRLLLSELIIRQYPYDILMKVLQVCDLFECNTQVFNTRDESGYTVLDYCLMYNVLNNYNVPQNAFLYHVIKHTNFSLPRPLPVETPRDFKDYNIVDIHYHHPLLAQLFPTSETVPITKNHYLHTLLSYIPYCQEYFKLSHLLVQKQIYDEKFNADLEQWQSDYEFSAASFIDLFGLHEDHPLLVNDFHVMNRLIMQAEVIAQAELRRKKEQMEKDGVIPEDVKTTISITAPENINPMTNLITTNTITYPYLVYLLHHNNLTHTPRNQGVLMQLICQFFDSYLLQSHPEKYDSEDDLYTLGHQITSNRFCNTSLVLSQFDVIFIIYTLIDKNFLPSSVEHLLTKYLSPSYYYFLYRFYQVPASLHSILINMPTPIDHNLSDNRPVLLKCPVWPTSRSELKIEPTPENEPYMFNNKFYVLENYWKYPKYHGKSKSNPEPAVRILNLLPLYSSDFFHPKGDENRFETQTSNQIPFKINTVTENGSPTLLDLILTKPAYMTLFSTLFNRFAMTSFIQLNTPYTSPLLNDQTYTIRLIKNFQTDLNIIPMYRGIDFHLKRYLFILNDTKYNCNDFSNLQNVNNASHYMRQLTEVVPANFSTNGSHQTLLRQFLDCVTDIIRITQYVPIKPTIQVPRVKPPIRSPTSLAKPPKAKSKDPFSMENLAQSLHSKVKANDPFSPTNLSKYPPQDATKIVFPVKQTNTITQCTSNQESIPAIILNLRFNYPEFIPFSLYESADQHSPPRSNKEDVLYPYPFPPGMVLESRDENDNFQTVRKVMGDYLLMNSPNYRQLRQLVKLNMVEIIELNQGKYGQGKGSKKKSTGVLSKLNCDDDHITYDDDDLDFTD